MEITGNRDSGQTDAMPPSDAVVLFDGSNLKGWKNGENWTVKDGVAYSGGEDHNTRKFRRLPTAHRMESS